MDEVVAVPDSPAITVLLLEDSPLDAGLIQSALRKVLPDLHLHRVATRDAFIQALRGLRFDVILSDYSLPGFDGLSALDIAHELAPETPFIFVSGMLGEEIAIDSFKRGATDYVLKQRLARLPSAVTRALAEARERAERRRAEENLRLLVAELSHRVKNTLATVQSIAHQTLNTCSTLEEFRDVFLGRLIALAEAHGLLFAANWSDTRMADILERTFAPFGRTRDVDYHLSGPPVLLPPKATLALSLIFHELATNALKYGALSREAGCVRIKWGVTGEAEGERLHLEWVETGGPPVQPPRRRGFGSKLLERSVRYELDGAVDLRFNPGGLECRFAFPLRQAVAERGLEAVLSAARPAPAPPAAPARNTAC